MLKHCLCSYGLLPFSTSLKIGSVLFNDWNFYLLSIQIMGLKTTQKCTRLRLIFRFFFFCIHRHPSEIFLYNNNSILYVLEYVNAMFRCQVNALCVEKCQKELKLWKFMRKLKTPKSCNKMCCWQESNNRLVSVRQ